MSTVPELPGLRPVGPDILIRAGHRTARERDIGGISRYPTGTRYPTGKSPSRCMTTADIRRRMMQSKPSSAAS
jgi:hypothetical protein